MGVCLFFGMGMSISMTVLVRSACLSLSLERQIIDTNIYTTMEGNATGILVAQPCFQQQKGKYDCGLLVIATAFHLTGNDLQQISFDQKKLLAHLARCYKRRRLTRFPEAKEVSSPKK